jgi:hypothetical protein
MGILPLDAAVGVLLLAAIAFAALRSSRRVRSPRVRVIGWALIAGPLPLAVVQHILLSPRQNIDQAAFFAGAAAFAIGALLVLGRDEEDWREAADESSPPWWPAFERDFREYELESSRRRRVIRV